MLVVAFDMVSRKHDTAGLYSGVDSNMLFTTHAEDHTVLAEVDGLYSTIKGQRASII